MTISGNKDQVAYLISCGVIPPFCSLLNCKDTQVRVLKRTLVTFMVLVEVSIIYFILPQVIQVVLDGIVNVLKMSTPVEVERVCHFIEECGGLDKIESLQNHENIEIYRIAFTIIEDYFSDEVFYKLYIHLLGKMIITVTNIICIACLMQIDGEDEDLVPDTADGVYLFDPNDPGLQDEGGYNF